jgi:hypothetical protein
MAQVVDSLPSKHKAPSSNHNTAKKRKRRSWTQSKEIKEGS